MELLGNVFVKKALKSMMTEEQFKMMEKLMTAVQSGKIDKDKLKSVGEKFSKLSVEEINKLLNLVDKSI